MRKPTCDICNDPLSDSFSCYRVTSLEGMAMLICETCRRYRPHPSNVVSFPQAKQKRVKGGVANDRTPFAA